MLPNATALLAQANGAEVELSGRKVAQDSRDSPSALRLTYVRHSDTKFAYFLNFNPEFMV